MLTPEHLAECLAHLAQRGLTLRLNGETLEIRDLKAEERVQRRRKKNRDYYYRKKRLLLQGAAIFSGDENLLNQAEIGLNPVEIGLKRSESRPKSGEIWRGITWRDVPGRDEAARKMRFSLLKRGDWRGYKSCQFLEGDALKAAFAKITEGQKSKSQKAATMRTQAAQKRNQSQA